MNMPTAGKTARTLTSVSLLLAFSLAALALPRDAFARPFRHLTRQSGVVDYWPRFSPDGKTVMFSRCELSSGCGGGKPGGHWTLWTVPASGGQAQEFLTIDGVSATRSNWISDPSLISNQIAFTGVDTSGTDRLGLWFVNSDGSNPHQVVLPDSVGGPSYPSWFPGGTSVAVTGKVEEQTGPHLTQVAVATGDPILTLTLPTIIWTGQPAVSHDGTTLAIAAQQPVAGQQYDDNHNQIWIQAVGDPTTQDLGLHELDGTQSRTPDWSPNDKFLIFESNRACVNGNYAIFMEVAVGGAAIQATDCNLNANHGVWSPDGKRFAFSYVFGNPHSAKCADGPCRGIAIAPVPAKIRRLGTAD